mmetsp:Transcript_20710/g.52575  ORF Transcript_20710/g.52575 Transcript_20710/m.52575 type:complete len:210 (-) Transcript_20710:2671-3300(-)
MSACAHACPQLPPGRVASGAADEGTAAMAGTAFWCNSPLPVCDAPPPPLWCTPLPCLAPPFAAWFRKRIDWLPNLPTAETQWRDKLWPTAPSSSINACTPGLIEIAKEWLCDAVLKTACIGCSAPTATAMAAGWSDAEIGCTAPGCVPIASNTFPAVPPPTERQGSNAAFGTTTRPAACNRNCLDSSRRQQPSSERCIGVPKLGALVAN